MPTAPSSVGKEVSANQAKKSVAGDDSEWKMGLFCEKVKDAGRNRTMTRLDQLSGSSGKATETRVPRPTSL